jgi:hypothetical protein
MTTLYVYNQLQCPNIDCNIGAPDTYHQEWVPPSPAHRQLSLTQFLLDQSLLPAQNHWMVAAKPKLKLWDREKYFVAGYRVLRLHHISKTRELGWDWVVFFGAEGNTRKVIVMVLKSWACQLDDSRFSVFLSNFFCFV